MRTLLLVLSLGLAPVLLVPVASAGTWRGQSVCCAFADGDEYTERVLQIGETVWLGACAVLDKVLSRDPEGGIDEALEPVCSRFHCGI